MIVLSPRERSIGHLLLVKPYYICKWLTKSLLIKQVFFKIKWQVILQYDATGRHLLSVQQLHARLHVSIDVHEFY